MSFHSDTLSDTIQKLAKELPADFIVKLCVENGSAWVDLTDEYGNEYSLPDTTDKELEEQLTDALDEAMRLEADEGYQGECPVCGEPYWKCDHE